MGGSGQKKKKQGANVNLLMLNKGEKSLLQQVIEMTLNESADENLAA